MSLEKVPNVNSKEFAEFLKQNGFEEQFLHEYDRIVTKRKEGTDDMLGDGETKDYTSPKRGFSAKDIFEKIDQWSINHPGTSLIIFFGGSGLICYKILQMFVAGAVFKGNLKTLKYISRVSR